MPSDDPGSVPPNDSSPPSDSRSFADRLEDGWARALEHLPLAVVPLVSSLLAVDNVRRVLEFRGVHFGLAFRFPSALPDLWTFVSVPNQGPGVHVSPTLAILPVLIVVRSALVAGLLGSVHEIVVEDERTTDERRPGRAEQDGRPERDGRTDEDARTGEYDFAANARRYFAPVLVFEALVAATTFAAFGVVVAALPLALLVLPAFLLLSYLFYATPYLLVVADASVGEALARSYELAVAGGPYFAYGAGYLLFVTALSLVATAAVVNLGIVGVLLGAVVTAPVALALTFATTEFVAELADSTEPPAAGRWEP